mmetsp:Transcript_8737/g.17784  ORF Transcript_8737/g.17784 Transcript_8737/m.17784 type:complete len:393 (-) Transcript_8737:89-1267(-)
MREARSFIKSCAGPHKASAASVPSCCTSPPPQPPLLPPVLSGESGTIPKGASRPSPPPPPPSRPPLPNSAMPLLLAPSPGDDDSGGAGAGDDRVGESCLSLSVAADDDDNGGGGGGGISTASGTEQECGLSLEIWDEPSVAGHKFLGRVLLDKATLARLVLAPSPVPLQLPLTDAPDSQVPKAKKLGGGKGGKEGGKHTVRGTFEIHARSSHLPDAVKDALAGPGAAQVAKQLSAAQPGGFSVGAPQPMSPEASGGGGGGVTPTSPLGFPSSPRGGNQAVGWGGSADHLRSPLQARPRGDRENLSTAFGGGPAGGGKGDAERGRGLNTIAEEGRGEAKKAVLSEDERKLELLLRETALQNRAARRQEESVGSEEVRENHTPPRPEGTVPDGL